MKKKYSPSGQLILTFISEDTNLLLKQLVMSIFNASDLL